jgi:hypothetical protein
MFERSMWRYYAISAAIVLVVGSIVFAHRIVTGGWRTTPEKKSATRHVNPGNANAGYTTTPPPSFTGQGDWVMSALPECFTQQSSLEGPSGLVAAHIPSAAQRIAPGTTLRRGDCTIQVRANDIWIRRGKDAVRVPPDARLYATPRGLTLVNRRGARTTIRVY